MICEFCGKEHDGSYGSGRFCSKSCRMKFIASKVKIEPIIYQLEKVKVIGNVESVKKHSEQEENYKNIERNIIKNIIKSLGIKV